MGLIREVTTVVVAIAIPVYRYADVIIAAASAIRVLITVRHAASFVFRLSTVSCSIASLHQWDTGA